MCQFQELIKLKLNYCHTGCTHKRKTLRSYPGILALNRINIISANLNMFDLFLPFIDRCISSFNTVFPSNFAWRTEMNLLCSWKRLKLSNHAGTPSDFRKLDTGSTVKTSLLLYDKNLFKMISLFVIFVCEDSKQLVSRLYGAIFQFYAVKSAEDAVDTDVWELCRSAPLHPVKCPVNAVFS